jgi:hypothetical protein
VQDKGLEQNAFIITDVLKSSHSPADTFIKSIYPGSCILIFYLFRIPDLGFRIQDPGPTTATKEEGEKKCVFLSFFEARNITKFSLSSQNMGLNRLISRNEGSKRHRIPDPDPKHWITVNGCVYKNT